MQQIERKPRRCGCTGWLETLRESKLDVKRGITRPVVERIESQLHLEVRQRELIAKSSREERAPLTDSGEPADDLHSRGSQNVEVKRRALGRANKLRRWQTARALEIVDLVVTLVPDSRSLHPPQHVAPAVGARQPHVLPDRERH